MQQGLSADRYDFLCGNDFSLVKIALNHDDYHTVRIQAESARTIDFTGGVKNLDEIIINQCLNFTRILWPENASIKRLKIGNCPELTALDLSSLTGLEELSIVDCNQLGEIKGLSEQLRFINIQGCQLDSLNIHKIPQIESLILSTSCSHFHLPLASHHALRVAIINMGDMIKNEKMQNNNPHEIQKINKLECDFSDCTHLDTLHIKSSHSPAIINMTGCTNLVTGLFSIEQKSEMIGAASCLNLRKEKNSIKSFNKIEKFRLHNKKYAMKMPKNPDDIETIVQENGALRKKNKACIVKINLLMGPKLENIIYQNSLYQFLSLNKRDFTQPKYPRLASSLPYHHESFASQYFQALLPQKYNSFHPLKMKKFWESTFAADKFANAASLFLQKKLPQTFFYTSPQYPFWPYFLYLHPLNKKAKYTNTKISEPAHDKKSASLNTWYWNWNEYPFPKKKSHNKSRLSEENQNILNEEDDIATVYKKFPDGNPLNAQPFLVFDEPEKQNLAVLNISQDTLDDAEQLPGELDILTPPQETLIDVQSNPLNANPFLIFDEPQKQHLQALHVPKDNNHDDPALLQGELDVLIPSQKTMTALQFKPLEATPSLIFDAPENQNIVTLHGSQDKNDDAKPLPGELDILTAAQKTMTALQSKALEANPSLIFDEAEKQNLEALHVPKDNNNDDAELCEGELDIFENKKIKPLFSKNMSLFQLSECSSTLSVKHTEHHQPLDFNACMMGALSNLINMLQPALQSADKKIAEGKPLEATSSLIFDEPEKQNLAALNISPDKNDTAGLCEGELDIFENKKIKPLLSKNNVLFHLSERCFTVVNHDDSARDMNTCMLDVLKKFNELFVLLDDHCKNSYRRNSTALFMGNKNTSPKHHFLTTTIAFNEAMKALKQVLCIYSPDREQKKSCVSFNK